MAKVQGTFYTAERLRRGTSPVSPPYLGEDGQPYPVNPPGSGNAPLTPPVAKTYASEAAMIADQASQLQGYLYFDGAANWWYKGTVVGDITDYQAFGSGSGSAPVAATYANQAAMIAAQGSQVANYFYFDSVRYWEYLGTTAGTIADYRKAVFGVSPYDLAQEGATNGQVVAWVSANSRYEPVTFAGSSNWTVGTGFIYRNGPVVIGDTVWSNATSLTVKGNATFGSWILKIQDSAGSNLIQLLNDGRLSLLSSIVNIGNSPSGASGVTIKSFSAGTAALLQLQDSSGNVLYNINSNGESYFRSSRINYGLPSGAPSTGITIKVPGTGFTHAHAIQDSANSINMVLYANGSVYAFGTRHVFGPVSGSISDGAHFKGASTGTNAQFAIDNSAATRLLSVLGNGDISFSEGRGFIFGTTTGWKIGTATTQKLAFWNKTPIIQPTTGITGATLAGGGGTTITDTHTFGGYTLQQLAAALINTGLIA